MTASGFCAVAALSRYTSDDSDRPAEDPEVLPDGRYVEDARRSVGCRASGCPVIEFLVDHPRKRFAQRGNFYPVDYILSERVGQQTAGFQPADSPGLQVEGRLGVQLPDGCAVGAAHVVGQDLQLGFGIDYRGIGKQKVLVSLLRVGLLRVPAHEYAAVERGGRPVVEDTFVEFVAGGVGPCVIDGELIVYMLGTLDHVQSVERGIGAFRKPYVRVVPYQRTAERDGSGGVAGVAPEFRLKGCDVMCLNGFALNLVAIDDRSGFRDDFGHTIIEVSARTPEGLDQCAPGARADNHEGAGMRYSWHGARNRHIDQMNGFFDYGVGCDAEKCRAFEKCRVQSDESVEFE